MEGLVVRRLPFFRSSFLPFSRALPGLATAVLVLLPAGRAHAEVYTLRLQDAGPAEVERELSRVLRTPVVVRGGAGRKVSVVLSAAVPAMLLDRTAALLSGSWSAKLRVTAGQKREEGAPVPPVLERMMALGLQDVPAQRAFSVIARELRADLETSGPLDARVTVLGVNTTAATLLDRIADQANARWSLAYQIEAPAAIEESKPLPPPAPKPEVIPAPMPLPPPPAAPPKGPSVPSAASVRAALWDGIKDVVRVPPDQRAAAVTTFLRLGEQLVRSLDRLSPIERQEYTRTLRPLLDSWRRLFGGLAPGLQKQLAPVTEALQRWVM